MKKISNPTQTDPSVPKNSLGDKTQKIVLLAGGTIFIGAMLFFTYGNSNKVDLSAQNPEYPQSNVASEQNQSLKQSSITDTNNIKPVSSSASLKQDFLQKSKLSNFSSYYQGLVGSKYIKDTVQYSPEIFDKKIVISPLENALPPTSALLDGFPFTTFGDSTLNIKNPLNTPLIAKLIFHDESDQSNYAVRHFYIMPNSTFVLTGLLEGTYQVAALSTEYPDLSFVTQLFNIYDHVEDGNSVDMLGKQINPTDIF